MSYIGNEPVIGHFPVDEFTSNGSSQTYTLSKIPPTVNSIEVSVGGLLQPPSVYSISGTTLTLPTSGANVPNGIKVVVRHLGEKLQVATVDSISGYNLTGIVVAKGDGASTPGKVKINCEMNSHGVTIQSPAHSSSANYTLTLPTTDGNASEFLQTDGSGALSWGAAGGGGATTLIARNTFTNATTVSITSGFDGNVYDSYRLIIRTNMAANGNVCALYTSSNGGSSWDSGSSDYHNPYRASNGAGADGSGANRLSLHGTNLDNDLGANLVSDITIAQTHETGKYTIFFINSVYYTDTGNSSLGNTRAEFRAGVRASTTAINAIQLFNFGGTTHTGSYTFYGYKKA